MNKLIKTAFIAAIGLLSIGSTKAQFQKYVNSAWNELNKNDDASLISAKEEIDKAMTINGATDNSYFWLIRSMVYTRIYSKRNTDLLKDISASSGYTSGSSMLKFYQSPTKKKRDIEEADQEIYSSFVSLWNESMAVQEAKDYTKLVDYMDVAHKLYGYMDTNNTTELAKSEITSKLITEKLATAAYNCTDNALKFKIFNDLLAAGNYNPFIIDALSKTYLENGDTAKAESVIRDAMAKKPGDNGIFQILINYYVSIDRVDKLFEDLQKQIDLAPDSKLYYARGVLYENRNEFEKALSDYKKAIELDEFNYDANNNYGRLLLNYRRKQLLDAKYATNANTEARRAAEKNLTDMYLEAKKHLEMAADNKNYEPKDLIAIYKTLKNVALEMNDQAEADKYDAMAKALEE